jgi:hypothetical protein
MIRRAAGAAGGGLKSLHVPVMPIKYMLREC